VREAGLDADEDADTIAALVEVADALEAGVEDAEEWDDLSVREQLDAQGFYDSLGEKHKDYPPEWTALKNWEQEGNVEMVLLSLETFDSEFMERHALESLERMADPEALDAVLERAQKRDKPAIRILGKTADERAIEDLHEFTDGDPGVQRVTLNALGKIGSEDSTQHVANCLDDEEESVRSHAARALGLIGDTRAVEPLSETLAEDDADAVRASAAWALVQIGTEAALEAAAEYADDPSYIVQSEAEVAASALDSETAPTA
jgi:HEAT repeat protein